MTGRSNTAIQTPRRPAPDRQCTETAKSTGNRCSSWSTRDSDRCASHDRYISRRLPAHRAVTASVAKVDMEGTAWQDWRFGDRQWQREAWRLYDITGQLRFVANWVGNSVSRCRLYVADVDEAGEAGEETQDAEVAALAAGPLGQGPAKDEALRLLGINMFVPGEAYIVAEADGLDDGEDRWFVVSSRQIKRSGSQITIRRSQLQGGGDMVYRDDLDLILRVWTPHPADTDEPDSPTRSAIPDLRELEAIRKREFAELDSRLAGAGILPLPEGMDFPRGDDDPVGLPGFTQLLMRAMATSLQNRAAAEAMVPIMFTVPGEFLDKIKPVTFWSELSSQLLPLREAAIKSLAQSLDVPAEILLGVGDVNHWTGWLISEDAVSTQIVPVLSRIADALTTGYLRDALEAIGRDPDEFVYAFDTAPLTTRPNRSADALNYFGAGLISEVAAVEAGAFRNDQRPDEKERLRRLAERIILGAPSLATDPVLRELVGIGPAPAPPPQQEQPPPEEQPVAEPAEPAPEPEPRALPEQTPQTEDAAAILAVSNQAMLRALGLAGSRLVPHKLRDRWPDTPKHQLHSKHGAIERQQAELVLRGAWDELGLVCQELYVDAAELRELLHQFAVELLTRGIGYEPGLLRDCITTALGRRLVGVP